MLQGPDVERLGRAVASAVDFDSLQTFVFSSTGDRLFKEFVAPGKPLVPTLIDLINALEEAGLTSIFLATVYERRPSRKDLRDVIRQLCPDAADMASRAPSATALSVQSKGAVDPGMPRTADTPGFQRNVRPHLEKLDVRIWRDRLAAIERRVCRVDFGGNALGTGFLVGPDLVLTNWHVVERAASSAGFGSVSCLFDYMSTAEGARPDGTRIALHHDALVDSSPYSRAELTDRPDDPLPADDELDYALLRLDRAIGSEAADGGSRGWLVLSGDAAVPRPGDPLMILQHPDGAPLKLALDTQAILAVNANGTRIRYATNTDPGSSGSPCFTLDWDLVALHHFGDPAWRDPRFNQGVPVGKIRHLLDGRGRASGLGAAPT
jgi:hypothetical protein